MLFRNSCVLCVLFNFLLSKTAWPCPARPGMKVVLALYRSKNSFKTKSSTARAS